MSWLSSGNIEVSSIVTEIFLLALIPDLQEVMGDFSYQYTLMFLTDPVNYGAREINGP